MLIDLLGNLLILTIQRPSAVRIVVENMTPREFVGKLANILEDSMGYNRYS